MAVPAAPFTECPAVGADTSCGVLVQVTNGETNVYSDPGQGPYDGADDTLTGVVNNSSQPVSSLQLSSNTNLFGFDSDGLCTASPQPAGCPFGPTGYEGPGTSFSDISSDGSGGVVNFSPPLAPGATAYFSLEEALTGTAVFAGGPTLSEQGRGANPSEHVTVCFAKQPINCASGDFLHDFTDAKVPGRGPALQLDRSYASSAASVDGLFGFGWTDSYGMSLATDAAGNVTISQENGATVTFRALGFGVFSAPPRVLATLLHNSDGTYTFTRRANQIGYRFSGAGQLLSETDLNGATTTLTYTGTQLSTVTDPAGRTLTFSYTGTHIGKVTDPLGRTTTYAYDTAGNLAKTTDPAGRSFSFGYDTGHQLLTMTDPRGGVVTNVYDTTGRVVRQTDAAGLATTWAYAGDPTSPAGGSTTMTDEHGVVTAYAYANLELTALTRGAGTAAAATTSYSYDVATLGRATITDPLGHVTRNTYDNHGNLTSTTDPSGLRTSYAYNSLDEVTSRTTPSGETTSMAYDGTGNLLSMTDPLGKPTNYAHGDPAHPGDVTAVTDADGRTKTLAYDTSGNVTSSAVSPTATSTNTTKTVYDADGEQICQTAPYATVSCPAAGAARVAGTTTWSYNPDGQLTSITDPAGHVATNTYDAGGNLTATTDAIGNTTGTAYDADNRPTTVTKGTGTASAATTSTSYDQRPGAGSCPSAAAGAAYCTTQTDPNSNVTTTAYTVRGQVLSEIRPGGLTTNHQYDLAGNETGRTNPAGQATTYGYDPANRPTTINYSDGSTPNVTYGYDPDGRRATMTDGTGTSTYTYDPAGHLTATRDGAGNEVHYGYDGAGNATTVTYPGTKTLTRAVDGAGRLTAVTDWAGHTTTFGYDPNGNLATTNYPNGDTVTTTFDTTDQETATQVAPTGTPAAPLAALSNTRDANSQLTREAATTGLSRTTAYTYDAKLQLTSANGTAYSYDLAGNPTKLATTVTQTFDHADQLTTATSGATTTNYGYDQRGNRTTASTPTATSYAYTYDQADRLTTVTSTKPATPAPTVTKIAPASGPSAGGTTVTITGTGLTGATAVTFGTVPATSYTVVSDTSVTAVSPPGTGTADITVTTPGGTSAVTAADRFTYTTAPKPAVTAVIPNRGPSTGNTYAVIIGTNLAHATAVKFGTKPARFYQSRLFPMLIFVAAPAGTGTVDVTVTTAAGTSATSAADRYTYVPSKTRSTWQVPDFYATSPPATSASATTAPVKSAIAQTPPTTVATYAYDGNGLRTAKTAAGVTQHFTWDTSTATPELLTDGTTNYIYGPDGLPVEQIDNDGQAGYFFHDQLGSTRALLGADGKLAATYTYDAYGRAKTTGPATTPLTFTGAYSDTETGFSYLIHRYYDPATAQFLTVDPALALTGDAYRYAESNPANNIDPNGTWVHIALGAIVGAAAGAIVGGTTYAVNVWANKEPVTLNGFLGATVGGAVGGAITGACDTATVLAAAALCGATGGAAAEGVQQLFDWKFDPGKLAGAAAFGFVLGPLGKLMGTGDLFTLRGPRPWRLSNLWNTGKNTWRMFGNDLSGGFWDEFVKDSLRVRPNC
ncbi:hypothetical protein DMA12_20735 [Amycolatopsis balhimycina DSM 5908]|uniref:IPT/TIG domain-containing protein n=1 Tax=Amycolatopsis balhimycina DSM 5908 TaxID=1081091 RepID=A0A428WHZ2_AMYBA|nr:hypothetical protein DMA12_20735 [Amycolatopsis balhimycina DSM 5908]